MHFWKPKLKGVTSEAWEPPQLTKNNLGVKRPFSEKSRPKPRGNLVLGAFLRATLGTVGKPKFKPEFSEFFGGIWGGPRPIIHNNSLS